MTKSSKFVQTEMPSDSGGAWYTTGVVPDDSFEQELFMKTIDLVDGHIPDGVAYGVELSVQEFTDMVREQYGGLLDVYHGVDEDE